MSHPDIHAYVVAARSYGLSDDAIRKELIGTGWSAADVDASLGTSVAPRKVRVPQWIRVAGFATASGVAIMLMRGPLFSLVWFVYGNGTRIQDASFGARLAFGPIYLAVLVAVTIVMGVLGKKFLLRSSRWFTVVAACLVMTYLASLVVPVSIESLRSQPPAAIEKVQSLLALGDTIVDTSGNTPFYQADLLGEHPLVVDARIRWRQHAPPLGEWENRELLFDVATGSGAVRRITDAEKSDWPKSLYPPGDGCVQVASMLPTDTPLRLRLEKAVEGDPNCRITAHTDRYVAFHHRPSELVVGDRLTGNILFDRGVYELGDTFIGPETSYAAIIGDKYYYLSSKVDVSEYDLVSGAERVVAHAAKQLEQWGVGNGFVVYMTRLGDDSYDTKALYLKTISR